MIYSQEEFHLLINPGDVGEYVILTGDPGRVVRIAGELDEPEFVKSNREFTIYNGKLDGTRVTVCSTGIGGPSTVIALEELVHCGSHTFIRLGTCGGMDVDVLGGDLVIATGAIRAEGTSREYLPIEFPAVANFDVVDALRRAAKNAGYRFHTGVVQSKDSFYGQHDPDSSGASNMLNANWEAWLKGGALGSEMECAAMFCAAALRKVRAGGVVTSLGNQTRRKLGLPDTMDFDLSQVIHCAVEAMRILIREDALRQTE